MTALAIFTSVASIVLVLTSAHIAAILVLLSIAVAVAALLR